MKQILIFLLVIVYLSTSAGLKMDLFFCCGKLDKISFFQKKELDFCASPKMQSKSCCDHQAIFFKLDNEHKSAAYTQFNFKSNFICLIWLVTLSLACLVTLRLSNRIHDGSPYDPPERCILYCVYRI